MKMFLVAAVAVILTASAALAAPGGTGVSYAQLTPLPCMVQFGVC